MTTSAIEQQAMRRALALAATPGVPHGPNPRVGCVILDDLGTTIAEGFHRGAGTAHAEAAALAEAGEAARGATAVVTLEPCNHTGRTGPCSEALISAGVRRVVYAQADDNPIAIGGAERLRSAGVEVLGGVCEAQAQRLNRAWTFAVANARPFVTWKFATTLDGRSSALDGTSRWISSRAARLDAHRLRAECDTILVGTNTVAVDDPELTVRDDLDRPVAVQPLRGVMGLRDLAPDRRVFNGRADTVRLRTRNPEQALSELHGLGRQHVFLEGGASLAGAFLKADLIDEVVAYVAPMFLGEGAGVVSGLGIATVGDALHMRVTDVTVLDPHDGEDVNVRFTMTRHDKRSM